MPIHLSIFKIKYHPLTRRSTLFTYLKNLPTVITNLRKKIYRKLDFVFVTVKYELLFVGNILQPDTLFLVFKVLSFRVYTLN